MATSYALNVETAKVNGGSNPSLRMDRILTTRFA